MKKLCATLLAMLMVVSAMPLTANAAQNNVAASSSAAKATAATTASADGTNRLKVYPATVTGKTGALPAEMESLSKSAAQSAPETKDSETAANLPSYVDNSDSKYFPSIGDQGSIGSCTCWATIYYQMSYEINKQLNRTATQGNSMSPLWVYNFINRGKNVGTTFVDAYITAKEIGVPSNANDRHSTNVTYWNKNTSAWSDAQQSKVTSFNIVANNLSSQETPVLSPDDDSLDDIKSVLANGDLLTFTTPIDCWNYAKIEDNSAVPENSKYKGQWIVPYYSGSVDGLHRMTFVGYDDDLWVDINGNGVVENGEKGALKVANSWGDSYENNGYVWVSYDNLNRVSSVNTNGLSNRRSSSYSNIFDISKISVNAKASSGIELRCTINSQLRDTDTVKISAAKDGATVASYTAPFNSSYQYTSNGLLSFDGSKNASSIDYAIDLSNIIPGITSSTLNDYTWTVEFGDTKNDTSTLNATNIKLMDTNTCVSYDATSSVSGLNNSIKKVTFSKTASSQKYYTVKFLNYYGDIISEQCVQSGKAAVEPSDPGDSNYTFQSWDKKFDNVTSNLTVTGKYIKSMSISSLTVDKNILYTGESCNANVNVDGGSGKFQYDITVSRKDGSYGGMEYLSSENLSGNYTQKISNSGDMRAADYIVKVKVTDNYTNLSVSKTIDNLKFVDKLAVNSFTTNVSSAKNLQTIKLTADANGGVSPYTYRFGYILNGVKTYINSSYQTSNTINTTFSKEGTYKLFVTIKDKNDKTETKYIDNYTVSGTMTALSVNTFTTDDSDNKIYKGDTLKLTASAQDGSSPYTYRFGYIFNGETTYLNTGYQSEATINAQLPNVGTYKLFVTAKDLGGKTATKYIDNFKVAEPNKITVYYYNSSYATPYIHYKAGDGEWTSVPGVRMESASDKTGYAYKYTVTLGAATTFTCCFNDGKGNWDNNNGSDYKMSGIKGNAVYGIKDKTINNLSNLKVTLNLDKRVIKATEYSVNASATVENAVGQATTTFSYSRNGVSSNVVGTISNYASIMLPRDAGVYTVTVTATDEDGNVATDSLDVTVESFTVTSFTASPASECYVNDTVTFGFATDGAQHKYGLSYGEIAISKDGRNVATLTTDSSFKAEWTPTEAGTYTATLTAKEYGSSNTVTKTMQYVVNSKVTSNKITIYYNTINNRTPYIHYNAGNSGWTPAPGVIMNSASDKPGYQYKYTVDLGTATTFTCCFNDGNGTWDNNNTSNYYISGISGSVSYGIKNNTITKL